eukprot:CAMPEP_0206184538 /NCGR_PEP_ID=MMETSP0166-20121206/1286_1 /ASSEMBLY_ACC=CAM_ASM_000260 /TAXON_ID=95228 /ORGANISM="Vannella robusta, Strain DIVA3 518/3/11/1/6" /LENGTH=259 /DNA_ID=CAMNT_0053599589 /DNA_START=132 /DNA_END=908 /DNA_ORIENTATION=-
MPPSDDFTSKSLYFTYWSGPIDETVLLCWYLNLVNPHIHQVIYLDEVPDLEEKQQKHPFLLRVHFVELDWARLLDSTGKVFDLDLLRRIPNYQDQQRTDIFRYLSLLAFGDGYMDAEQCILDFTGDRLPNVDFAVYSSKGNSAMNNIFRFSFENLSRLQAWFADEFLPGRKMVLAPNADAEVIGAAYFQEALRQNQVWPAPNPSFEMLFEENLCGKASESFCDMWNTQIQSGIGVFLYPELRAHNEMTILRLLERHEEA